MIAIHTGGVFSAEVDVDDMKKRIAGLVRKFRDDNEAPDLGDEDGDPTHCMSRELTSHKGGYVVLAGVFNYWGSDYVDKFARALSEEFGTQVMQMTHDDETGEITTAKVWLAGRDENDVNENPIARVLRQVGG
jgi:hypothetical protein